MSIKYRSIRLLAKNGKIHALPRIFHRHNSNENNMTDLTQDDDNKITTTTTNDLTQNTKNKISFTTTTTTT